MVKKETRCDGHVILQNMKKTVVKHANNEELERDCWTFWNHKWSWCEEIGEFEIHRTFTTENISWRHFKPTPLILFTWNIFWFFCLLYAPL